MELVLEKALITILYNSHFAYKLENVLVESVWKLTDWSF